MEPLSIGILIVVALLIIEVVVMLLKLKVDKMLLLMPLIGVIFAVISFVLNEYPELLESLSGSTSQIVIYGILVVGVIFGLFGVAVWFRGEKEARRLASAAKSIDSAVAGIESDIRGSGMEIEHFDEEMSAIKTKVEDYETKEKGV